MHLKLQGPLNEAFLDDFFGKDVSWILKHTQSISFHLRKQFAPWLSFASFVSLKKIKNILLENEPKIPSRLMESVQMNFPFKMLPFQSTNSSVSGGLQPSPWTGVHRGYLHKASAQVGRWWPLQVVARSSPVFSLKKGKDLGSWKNSECYLFWIYIYI